MVVRPFEIQLTFLVKSHRLVVNPVTPVRKDVRTVSKVQSLGPHFQPLSKSMEVFHESNAPGLLVVTILLLLLAIFFVALRFVARRIATAFLWWDDWLLVLALGFDFGLAACYWAQVEHTGLGRHTVAHGGPVDAVELASYFKVLQVSCDWSFTC